LVPVDCVARDLHDRHPPRLTHVCEVGAVRHHHAQSVAGVIGRRDGAVHRATEKSVDQHGIPFESTRPQDHSTTSTDSQLLTAGGDPDSDDRAVFGDQFFGAGIGMRSHAGIEQPFEQSGDQCRAGHAQIGVLVDPRMQAGPGLGVESDVGPVLWKRGDPITPLAELIQIERSRAKRAAATGLAAG
jgi:hypothetical protein